MRERQTGGGGRERDEEKKRSMKLYVNKPGGREGQKKYKKIREVFKNN